MTSEYLFAGAVSLQMSKIRSFEVAPLFVYERESFLGSFKHPSMHLIHFFMLSGSHIWSCEVNRGPSLAEGQPYGHQPEFGLSLHSKTPARHKMECCRKI